ncbi:MAG: hypothetical protein JW958_05735 [Candidatus Eisenbacteria bacterium]|nr:hypothetical protein [Candidatus Eisenbacteria bacterium]
MGKDAFEIVALVARPAAGKSEVIDYLKKVGETERRERFHVGSFEELDDFPIIWRWFQEDDVLTRMGRERNWTDERYYFRNPDDWNVLIEMMSAIWEEKLAADPKLPDRTTTIVEFARGGPNAFREAFSHLSENMLRRMAVLYIDVSYEESCRKNRRRARPGLEGSILHHSLPDDKMEFYYKENDWREMAPDGEGWFEAKGIRVPYVVLPNEPEVTDDPAKLGPALEKAFGALWRIRSGG